MGTFGEQLATAANPRMMEDVPGLSTRAGRVYSDKQLTVSRTTSPVGTTFVGEIDASNSHAVRDAVAGVMTPGHDLHVDVSYLQFCDISGIRALVAAATALKEGHRLLLHGMPDQLARVIKVVGWEKEATLVMCECGHD